MKWQKRIAALVLACLALNLAALAEFPEGEWAQSGDVEAPVTEAREVNLEGDEGALPPVSNTAGFSDPAFDEWVLANCDLDGDGDLSWSEAMSVTEMDLRDRQIASLAGLERFGALRRLYCDDNHLTELDVSGNPELEVLSCGGNAIDRLELGDCPALVEAVYSRPELSDGCMVFKSDSRQMALSLPARTAIWLYGAAYYDPAAALSIDEGLERLGVGQKRPILSEDSACPAVFCTYTTSKKKYVAVSAEGVASGVKAGKSVISVRCFDGRSASLTVQVPKAPSKVTISEKKQTLGVGESCLLTAVLPANTMSELTWTSSNETVVQVDDGLLTALAPGSATVTVTTANKKRASCAVTVGEAPYDLMLSDESLNLMVRQTTLLKAILPEGTAGQVEWACSGEAVSVNPLTGEVVALAEGEAVVTATTYNGLSAQCRITVTPGPAAILLPASVSIGVGQKLPLSAETISAEGVPTGHLLNYASSNVKYVTVSENGVVTGVKKGSATITASAPNGVKATCRVSVTKAPASLKLNQKSLEMVEGEQVRLIATPSDGIDWLAYDESVAQVDSDGTVTALSAGSTTITASTYNGKTATCPVRVFASETEREAEPEPEPQPEPQRESETEDGSYHYRGLTVVAHRGGCGAKTEMENTLEAFAQSASTGATMIEMDVQTTSDGVQVIHHDASFKAGGKTYKIPKRSYSTLKAAKPSLCTLDEALDVIYKTGLDLQLELKESANAKKCVAAIRKHNMEDRTWYISFNTSRLKEVRAQDSTARLGYIFSGKVPKNLYDTVKSLRIGALMVHQDLLSQSRLDEYHDAGLLVNAWTLNSRSQCKKFAEMGVDFITSNYPAYAVEYK